MRSYSKEEKTFERRVSLKKDLFGNCYCQDKEENLWKGRVISKTKRRFAKERKSSMKNEEFSFELYQKKKCLKGSDQKEEFDRRKKRLLQREKLY